MTDALRELAAAVDAALDDDSLPTDRDRTEAFRPALAALLAARTPLPSWACEPLAGQAVGNLVHVDPAGRYHIMAVVFPEGTSSGVHHHGCWGLIGYLRGGDEETRYDASSDDGDHAELTERERHVWHQGDITALLPPLDGWHRVRNPGPGDAVSVHVLCMTPGDHPHRFWRRDDGAVLPYPFEEVAPDRWVARIVDE